MAGTITIITGDPMVINYQPLIFFGNAFITYSSVEIPLIVTPGTYSIPPLQQDNLNWFYDNDFKFNAYGRKHLGALMADTMPDSIVVL